MEAALSIAVVAAVGGLLLYFLQLAIWSLFVKTRSQATELISGMLLPGVIAVALVIIVNSGRFLIGRPPSLGEFIVMPAIVAELFLVVLLALATIRRLKPENEN